MKRTAINYLMVTGLAIILFSFSFIKTGNIRGKVLPAEAAAEVLAVLGSDTLKTVVNNGNFTFPNIKTGTYTILVKGIPPYKDVSIKNVAVIDSVTTDVGVVKLQQ
ncbi:carboxypeptidase regulatory-like domain-containing protein [Pedobacter sp. ASV1-7]|uniref:carboxypeptidase regulatory-like domain-containing protein n=1 Tax=Pedobacter sp. ASV1-7 TaxID=3145237 RepID=UPI0032E8F72E